jgi:uncharacterized protein
VPTPVGAARVVVDAALQPVATVILGHGAGGGPNSADLRALAALLPERGLTVVRVEQPWHVEGRRVAPPPARLDVAWRAVVAAVVAGTDAGMGAQPLIIGGRSAGARVACRTASDLGAAAVVALAFPAHPPGRPERSRLAELRGSGVPTLVVQGERDSFGRPAEFPADLGLDVEIHPIPGADHSFAVPKTSGVTRGVVLADVAVTVADWVLARLRT